MTIVSYVIIILAVSSVSINLMRLIERIDHPQHTNRHAA